MKRLIVSTACLLGMLWINASLAQEIRDPYPADFIEVTDSLPINVKRKAFQKTRVHVGPYQMTDARKGWENRGGSYAWRFLNVGADRDKFYQRSTFTIANGSESVFVELMNRERSKDFAIGESKILPIWDKVHLLAVIEIGDSIPCLMEVKQESKNIRFGAPMGTLRYGSEILDLTTVFETRGRLLGVEIHKQGGIQFSYKGQTLAALELINGRHAYIHKNIKGKQRAAIIAAMTAIVYQLELNEERTDS